jgi:hypothetical protein
VSRSLLILIVTVVVVAAAYYGFSRFGSAGAPVGAAQNYAQPVTPAANGIATSAASPPSGVAPNAAAAASAVASNAAPAADSAASVSAAFAISISKAHPPAPSDVIRVKKDDPVTLSITTDRAGHLEVHGYRKEVEIEPGRTVTLSFPAVRTGRFPIDLHASDGAHVEVTALEVLPH